MRQNDILNIVTFKNINIQTEANRNENKTMSHKWKQNENKMKTAQNMLTGTVFRYLVELLLQGVVGG